MLFIKNPTHTGHDGNNGKPQNMLLKCHKSAFRLGGFPEEIVNPARGSEHKKVCRCDKISDLFPDRRVAWIIWFKGGRDWTNESLK